MRITFIENGIDSLQKGFEKLKKYERKFISDSSQEKERYLLLKDAVISIHHGIEILMKYILKTESEYLIFSNIDSNVKNAFYEKKIKKLDSVFETSLSNKLHTVTYEEAFERVQKICGHEFSKDFSEHILKLNELRNQITHAQISVNELDIKNLFKKFLDDIDIFFFKVIGEDYQTMNGYSNLVKNYNKYLELLEKSGLKMKKKAIEFYYDVFKELDFGMGFQEVRRITDINLATKIIDSLTESDFRFGTDMYNGHCSGDVSVMKRYDENRLSLFTADNNTEYVFKFKSMIIYLPEVESSFSPIIIFESDDDNDIKKDVSKASEKDYHDCLISEGIYFINDKRLTFNQNEISEFYCKYDDPNFILPEYHQVFRVLEKSLICHINIQGLEYGKFNSIIRELRKKDGGEFEMLLRKAIENK